MAAALGCAVAPLPDAGDDAQDDGTGRAPSVERFQAMILDMLSRLGTLADGIRGASDQRTLSPRRCLDLMLACQRLHQDLGRIAAMARRGAARDRA